MSMWFAVCIDDFGEPTLRYWEVYEIIRYDEDEETVLVKHDENESPRRYELNRFRLTSWLVGRDDQSISRLEDRIEEIDENIDDLESERRRLEHELSRRKSGICYAAKTKQDALLLIT